jgi:hypothetical protein
MSATNPTDHYISLNTAKDLTRQYRDNQEAILDQRYKGQGILPTCETFSKDAIMAVMSQSGCASLRIYMAMDTEMQVRMVLVGVDSTDNDMLGMAEPVLLEDGTRCPTLCPPPSVLNE